MAVNYIQPNTPTSAGLMNGLYSELDRKVNLVTNNKSIIFCDPLLLGTKYRFFDGASGVTNNVLDVSSCGTRMPNGVTGWYGFLLGNDISNKYSGDAYFENLVHTEVQISSFTTGQCSVAGDTNPDFLALHPESSLSNSLAFHKIGGTYYKVTGVQIISSGSGYTDGATINFKRQSGFAPFYEGAGNILVGPSGEVTGVQVGVGGAYFGALPSGGAIEEDFFFGIGTGFISNLLVETSIAQEMNIIPDSLTSFNAARAQQAELIFEGSSSFSFPAKYNRHKFFRIHNLNNYTLDFSFESGITINVPKHASLCVRRDFGQYTTGYTHFQKFISGDGRFDGIGDIGVFNNIYDPINHGISYINSQKARFVIDETKYWNGESLYFGAGKPFRPKEDSARFGDLYYHTGDMLFSAKYASQTNESAFKIQKIIYSGAGDPYELLSGQLPLSKVAVPSGYSIFYTGGSGSGEACKIPSIDLKIHLLQNHALFTGVSSGTSGINVSIVKDQISILNNAFSGNEPKIDIKFNWDENLIITSVSGSGWNDFDESFKALSPSINTNKFLNIWIFPSTGVSGISFATFPTSHGTPNDGIALNAYSMSGSSAGFLLGKTLIHEVGHYLGLLHIWGDGNCSVDDGITDTPDQDGPIFGCPNPAPFSCDGETPAMIQNYMNYTDDTCMSNFTTGQSDRMTAVLDTVRYSLQTIELKKAALFPITTNLVNHPNKTVNSPFRLATILTGLDVTVGGEYYRNYAKELFNFSAFNAGHLAYPSYPVSPGSACATNLFTGGFIGGNFTFSIHNSKPLSESPVGYPGAPSPFGPLYPGFFGTFSSKGYYGCLTNLHLSGGYSGYDFSSYYIPIEDMKDKYVLNTHALIGVPTFAYANTGSLVYNANTESLLPEQITENRSLLFSGTQGSVRDFPLDLKNKIFATVSGVHFNNDRGDINFNGVIDVGLNWSGYLNLGLTGAPIFNFFSSKGYILDSSKVYKKYNIDLMKKTWNTEHSPRTQEFEFVQELSLTDKGSYIEGIPLCGSGLAPELTRVPVSAKNDNEIFIQRDISTSFSSSFYISVNDLEKLRKLNITGCVTTGSAHSILSTGAFI